VSTGSIIRLALAGTRTDRLRVALTAFGTTLAVFVLLAAATVWWIPPTEVITENTVDRSGWRYTSSLLNETVTRPWLAAALVVLTIPALVLAAQSARLGAPARDRRLAAIRLAGATPGQVRLVVAAETATAGLAGAILGIAGYFVVRRVAHRPVLADAFEVWLGEPGVGPRQLLLPLPTDAIPPSWVFAAAAVAAPVLAALLSLVALRRVSVSPLAVTRQVPHRRLRWWPLAALGAGVMMVPVHLAAGQFNIGDQRVVLPATAWTAMLLMAVGLALSGAPLGQLAARATRRAARRPATLLAAQRVLADPWSGARSLAVVLVSTGIGAAAITGLAILRAQSTAAGIEGGRATGWSTESGTHTMGVAVLIACLATAGAGLLCALVEGTLARRPTLVTLVAAGTPRATLARVTALQALLPAAPAIGLALVVGAAVPRLPAREVRMYDGRVFAIPVPWPDLLALGAGAFAVVLLAVALSLPALRASTDLPELRTE
jgi:hypothetical protein